MVRCCPLLLLLPGLAFAQRAPSETTGLAFSRDGSQVLSAHLNGFVKVHDRTGKQTADWKAHDNGVHTLALSPDGKILATGGEDKAVKLWDAATHRELKTLTGHQQRVASLSFSPDGKLLASGGYEGTIRLWDVASGKEVRSWNGKATRVTGLAFLPDGKSLASVGTRAHGFAGLSVAGTDQPRLWDVESGKEKMEFPGGGTSVGVTADGETLAVSGYFLEEGGAGGAGAFIRINQISLRVRIRVALIDRATRREVLKLDDGGGAFALSSDGRFLATGRGTEYHIYNQPGVNVFGGVAAPRRGATLWEVQTGQEITQVALPAGEQAVLAMSPDGTQLAMGSRQGQIQVVALTPKDWDAAKARRADAKELEQTWADLASKDPGQAYRAIWTLSAAEGAVKLLREQLRPVKVDEQRIVKLVSDLDARRFAVREAALKELQRMGYDAEPVLRRLHKTDKLSLEVRKRLEELLGALDGRNPPPEAIRSLRAVAALERSGSAEAKHLLEHLTTGEPEARQTREARASLRRLAR